MRATWLRQPARQAVLVAVVGAAVLSVSPAPATAAPTTTARAAAACRPAPAAIAHRGGHERHTENTVGAFRFAAQLGVRRWELDVRFDAAGVPMVLHDETVDRVSPATGKISAIRASVTRVRTNDGQVVPTLREVLQEARRARAHVLTELKTTPTTAQWAAVARVIDSTVGRTGVTLMSFNGAVVLDARRRIPGTATALVATAGYAPAAQIKRYANLYVKHHSSFTRARYLEWRAAGLRQYAWTVNAAADWQRLASYPVDGMITDKPQAYTAWARRRCPG